MFSFRIKPATFVAGSYIKKRNTENDRTEVLLGITNPTSETCFELLMSSDMAWRITHLVHVRLLFLLICLTQTNFQHPVLRKNVRLSLLTEQENEYDLVLRRASLHAFDYFDKCVTGFKVGNIMGWRSTFLNHQ